MRLLLLTLGCSPVPAFEEVACPSSTEFVSEGESPTPDLLRSAFGDEMQLDITWDDGWAIANPPDFTPSLRIGAVQWPTQLVVPSDTCQPTHMVPVSLELIITHNSALSIDGIGVISGDADAPTIGFAYESDQYVENVSDAGLQLLYLQRLEGYQEQWDPSQLPEQGTLFYQFSVSLTGTADTGTLGLFLRDLSHPKGAPVQLFRGSW